ncbi:MAG: condensation domain-containing protein, partial [Psychrosphaera sp.]|nr:condensation domain-containing protein [Psychrosphaera sp.]
FNETDGDLVQVIQTDVAFKLTQQDLTTLDTEVQTQRINALILADVHKLFDLSRDLMLRACYLHLSNKAGKQRGILLFNMHHIASDGWSMGIFVNEFASQYRAVVDGQLDSLPPLDIQYADYAHWQRQWLSKEPLNEQLSYWKKHLTDMPVVHRLGLDYVRPAVKQYAGGRVFNQLNGQLSKQLQAMAQNSQVTLFMVLHAAVALLLSRHSNSTDIVLGMPVANRMKAEFAPLIGFFVNTLVLRVNTDHQTFAEYLAHVKQVNLAAQTNQDVPFEQLVEHCKVPRDIQLTPLFQIMFSMETSGIGDLKLPAMELSEWACDEVLAKFDLNISAQVNDEGILLSWVYDKSLFSTARIEMFSDHLQRLLTGIVNEPQAKLQKLQHLPMLSASERAFLQRGSSGTRLHFGQQQCLHQIFEQQVYQTP